MKYSEIIKESGDKVLTLPGWKHVKVKSDPAYFDDTVRYEKEYEMGFRGVVNIDGIRNVTLAIVDDNDKPLWQKKVSIKSHAEDRKLMDKVNGVFDRQFRGNK